MKTEDYRRTSHGIWQEMAPGWERRRGQLADALAPVRSWLVSELAPRPGDTVLELSAGAGTTGFEAAALVGERGRLLCTDFSAAMVEAARRGGAELGLDNVDYRVIDAERIELDADSVDGVLCQSGYMLMADPAAALAETRRVLKPGGRLALSVWGAPERNPWATVAARFLIERGHMPPPQPDAPGIFAMAAEERTRTLLAQAGFTAVRTAQVPVRFGFHDLDDYEGADGDDLLSRLLRARDPATGEAMDRQQVRDEALIFLLAGHETTSTALTFTLQLLGRHPSEQRLVHDELDAVLAGRVPTVEDAPALARTAMAIKEAMRLYPPAYALGRLAESENEIGGYRIPAGANVVVSQFATHRHPQFWEDADAFDPGRFSPERERARHGHAYFPFGAGPRACIGSSFAMLEATIALAVLLQRFRVHSELTDVPLDTAGITLRPRGAVPLRPAARG